MEILTNGSKGSNLKASNSKVITVKLQIIHHDFKTLHIKNGKLVHGLFARVAAIVN